MTPWGPVHSTKMDALYCSVCDHHMTTPSFLHRLPLSVQYCLVSLLCAQYPQPEVGVVNTEAVTAHVIYSEWVLKFVIQQCYSANISSRPAVQTWEATCVPTDQIKDLVCILYNINYIPL